jgi:ribosomal protein S18 acetylase RimI-like enzyme
LISGDNSLIIIKATPDDIDEIKRIADAHRRELGFVRRPSLLEAIDRSEVLIAKQNGSILGFVEYRHRKDEQTTLHNIAIVSTYQRKGIGRKLVERLVSEAQEMGKSHISLKCPVDLPANEFYKMLNFQLCGIEPGKRRNLKIWRWWI